MLHIHTQICYLLKDIVSHIIFLIISFLFKQGRGITYLHLRALTVSLHDATLSWMFSYNCDCLWSPLISPYLLPHCEKRCSSHQEIPWMMRCLIEREKPKEDKYPRMHWRIHLQHGASIPNHPSWLYVSQRQMI